jgi:lipopolysaccharide assembly outer membrane protein LptD (OstA)
VLVRGNVRLYRAGQLFTGERALYNFETKIFNAADFRGEFTPFRFGGDSVSTIGTNAYLVKEGIFTTSDNSEPDYYLRAKNVRIYPNDRIIFTNVKLYVGKTPIFWFPYVYQSLNREQGFTIVPGYSSALGSFLFSQYTFPLGEGWSGKARLDLMSERGIGPWVRVRMGQYVNGRDHRTGHARQGDEELGPLSQLLRRRRQPRRRPDKGCQR